MPSSQTWLDSKIAFTAEELRLGDGCHQDEAQALSDYLGDSISKEEAASRITAPILIEDTPHEETYRLWALLSEAIVELSAADRHKTLDLLSQIQALPRTSSIDWARLPGFASMWDTLYRLHLHGPDGWEREVGSFDDAMKDDFRQHFEVIGRGEAEMFVRGFDVVTSEHWAYKVLELVSSDRAGLDVLLGEVFAWLDVAAWRLREHAQADEARSEQWSSWREDMARLSRPESSLSETGRRLAARCHGLM